MKLAKHYAKRTARYVDQMRRELEASGSGERIAKALRGTASDHARRASAALGEAIALLGGGPSSAAEEREEEREKETGAFDREQADLVLADALYEAAKLGGGRMLLHKIARAADRAHAAGCGRGAPEAQDPAREQEIHVLIDTALGHAPAAQTAGMGPGL